MRFRTRNFVMRWLRKKMRLIWMIWKANGPRSLYCDLIVSSRFLIIKLAILNVILVVATKSIYDINSDVVSIAYVTKNKT